MNEKLNNQFDVEKRMIDLIDWIKKYAPFILSYDRVKLEINLKGKSVMGHITTFPE